MKPLSCSYFMTTKASQKQFPQSEAATLAVSVWLLFEGGVYFIGKPADINDSWIGYV